MDKYLHKSERSGGLITVRPVSVPSVDSVEAIVLAAKLIADGETRRLEIFNSTTGLVGVWYGSEFVYPALEIPEVTTIERDAIPTPSVGLKVYNLDNEREEYYHSVDGWIPTGGYAGVANVNGQSQISNTDGEIKPGIIRDGGTYIAPVNSATGLFTNYLYDLGINGASFKQVFCRGLRPVAGAGSTDGISWSSNASQIYATTGLGGGMFLKAGTRTKVKISYKADRGMMLSNTSLSNSVEATLNTVLQVGGVTRNVGQTALNIEALDTANAFPDGCEVYINDATSGVTITSTGKWLKHLGTWIKLH